MQGSSAKNLSRLGDSQEKKNRKDREEGDRYAIVASEGRNVFLSAEGVGKGVKREITGFEGGEKEGSTASPWEAQEKKRGVSERFGQVGRGGVVWENSGGSLENHRQLGGEKKKKRTGFEAGTQGRGEKILAGGKKRSQ